MSTLGPGECIEANLNAVLGILDAPGAIFNPNAFLNPQEINILNMRQGNIAASTKFEAWYAFVLPNSPDYPYLNGLHTAFQNLPNMINAYETWTNFLSGKSHVFPIADLDPNLIWGAGHVPVGWPTLATLTFAGLLGVVHGSRIQAHVTCNTDPNDPCSKMNGVFGAILGAFDSILGAIADGLNQIQSFVGKARELLNAIEGYIQQIAGIIANALDKLIAMIVEAIRYGMAKLLHALGLDGCMGQVLTNICAPQLKTAIGL